MAALLASAGAAGPGPGIGLELARERAAAIAVAGYRLRFELDSGATPARGFARVDFVCRQPGRAVVLDFAGGPLEEAVLNGAVIPPDRIHRSHDHLVLPAAGLRAGANSFLAAFPVPVAATGTPLTVYKDPAGGGEFLYTLLVPADAHRLFPCFDQPDLKAPLRLELVVPAGWTAVANAPGEPEPLPDGRRRFRFGATPPLSTYLFAFAAGPFQTVEGPRIPGLERPPRLLLRPSQAAHLEAAAIFGLHARVLALYAERFGMAYPFGKLDLVLVPGFPYGGMEHAGAIFYRETALCPDHRPTPLERLRMSTLVYHEVAHQWFGNLVTMRWFDDLWLKEGFATLMAFEALAALEEGEKAWLRFHQRVKAPAYAVDVTPGTTPVYQELRNLDDAKSAYGPIVYNKAPAVLRELQAALGEEAWRAGLRRFLARHAWGCASWEELLAALAEAAGRELGPWSRWWIHQAGLPRVRASWERDGAGRIASFRVSQESSQGWCQGGWPLRLELLLGLPGGRRVEAVVELAGPATSVPELVGLEAPLWVLPNPRDRAYGQFVLDPAGARALAAALAAEADLGLRVYGWSVLWQTFMEGELDPRLLLPLALDLLRRETDPVAHQQLVSDAATMVRRHLPAAEAEAWRGRLEELLLDQLGQGRRPGLELQLFRALAWLGRGPAALAAFRGVALGRTVAPGLEAGLEDRFLAATALLAAGHWSAVELGELVAGCAGHDVARHAFLAGAAIPDPAVKARYFDLFLAPREPPEQWVQLGLDPFHWPGQEELTFPFLGPALERLEWVKANRKIFFLADWLGAFLGAHSTPAALAVVTAFLAERPGLPVDIRRKVLQAQDGLARAVRIRSRWGG